jgi:asparagine synthase (glutamine-hydrolysing)
MAHSVEVRLPFLDYRLVSLARSLPAHWKLRGPWNKYVVRAATKGVIPESIRTRLDKMGFPQPSRDWFANAWYGPTRDLLSSRAVRESGALNVAHALRELDRHRAGEVDATSRMFSVAQFGLWFAERGKNPPPVSSRGPEPGQRAGVGLPA